MESLSNNKNKNSNLTKRSIKRPFRKSKKDVGLGDQIFSKGLLVPSSMLFVLLFSIAYFLFKSSKPAIEKFGFNFLTSTTWDPVQEIFGSLPVIFGTVVSSLLGVLIAAPLSIGIALFLNELAPKWLSIILGFLIEMLAAIPSVVYGLWGIFVLAPWMRITVQPFLNKYFGFLPLFQGPPYGVGMLTAGLIISIMITPTISSISKEVFKTVQREQREAALALGSTAWEMMKLSVLKSSMSGVWGAIILGLGRALGETMAVTMVIGNRAQVSASLFAPGQTMASVIANEYAEAQGGLHLAALSEIGLLLFFVFLLINSFAKILIARGKK